MNTSGTTASPPQIGGILLEHWEVIGVWAGPKGALKLGQCSRGLRCVVAEENSARRQLEAWKGSDILDREGAAFLTLHRRNWDVVPDALGVFVRALEGIQHEGLLLKHAAWLSEKLQEPEEGNLEKLIACLRVRGRVFKIAEAGWRWHQAVDTVYNFRKAWELGQIALENSQVNEEQKSALKGILAGQKEAPQSMWGDICWTKIRIRSAPVRVHAVVFTLHLLTDMLLSKIGRRGSPRLLRRLGDFLHILNAVLCLLNAPQALLFGLQMKYYLSP